VCTTGTPSSGFCNQKRRATGVSPRRKVGIAGDVSALKRASAMTASKQGLGASAVGSNKAILSALATHFSNIDSGAMKVSVSSR
jgi:hypothetical protein